MKTIKAAIVIASALAMLVLAPLQLAASARGLHGFHFSSHLHGSHHHRAYGAYGAYGAWPLDGGVTVVPPDTPDSVMTYAPPAQVVYVPEPPQALGCHRSEQTVTVPAEAGGTRQVSVTRC